MKSLKSNINNVKTQIKQIIQFITVFETFRTKLMNKVPISQNFITPTFQTINKNQQSTELILMDPENGNLYLLHQYLCEDSQSYGELVSLLQRQAAQGADSPYVLDPVLYLPIKYTNQTYMTSHFIQVLYQYGSHTLEQQLFLRIQQKNFFQQHQLWSILGSCILGLKFLKGRQFTHSSVCLNDIFVTKQGQIKICHPMFRTYDHAYSHQVDPYYIEKVLAENYYFSPQQLNQQFSEQSEDVFRSDVFSLGMAVLSLCMLQPLNECYQKKGGKFSHKIMIQSQIVEQYFHAIEQIYSPDLISILFSMLAFHPQERISIEQLANIIDTMIQAKKQEEEMEFSGKEEEFYELGSNMHSRMKNNENHLQSLNSQHSPDEKFGKLSRVSQASPISGRKSHYTPLSSTVFRISQSQPDTQDKPSSIPFQCATDQQNPDKPPHEQYSTNQTQQSIDQTLRHYINNEQSSHTSEVNQTLLYQEYETQRNNRNTFSPKEVVSVVMTSKELSSLPSESISFVLERRTLGENKENFNNNNIGSGRKIESEPKTAEKRFVFKNNALNQPIKLSNSQSKKSSVNQSKAENNIKSFLNTIKQQHKQLSQRDIATQNQIYPFSARNYNEHSRITNISQKENIFVESNRTISKRMQGQTNKEMKNSMSISLNKNYELYMQSQQTNPNSLYTDPKFLEAIRQDVDKILKKRKQTLAYLQNYSHPEPLPNREHIFINGKPVNPLRNQPLSFIPSTQKYRQISQFR